MTKVLKDQGDISRRSFLTAAVATSILPLTSEAATSSYRIKKMRKFDIDRFIEDCIAAHKEAEPQAAVLEVLAKAVSTPQDVLAAIGEPKQAGLNILLRSKTLTIFSATWTPQMNLMPHNHLMWANIGIYTGREDNILWRNTPKSIEAFGAKALFEGDAASLPVDVIHSVTNPLLRFTGGIHIYGGDFFNTTRSQWNPETLDKEPSDGAVIRRMFEQENQRMESRKGSNCGSEKK